MSQHYHHLIGLNVLALQKKGQLLEKFKRYDEAIETFTYGKQIVEANYGHSHKLYVDLANAINGAKLRTKYFQNSNLGPSG